MTKILLSGFDAVKGINDPVNPSIEIVKSFGDRFMGAQIVKLEVPTAFNRSRKLMSEAIEEHRPDIVLSLGVSPRRFNITVERVAINMRDGDMVDNDGCVIHDEAIFEDGDDAYFSNFDVRRINTEAAKRLIPMEISSTCGTYCCNQMLYTSSYFRAKKYPNMLTGFMHLPYFPEHIIGKTNAACMPADLTKKAAELCLEVPLDQLSKRG